MAPVRVQVGAIDGLAVTSSSTGFTLITASAGSIKGWTYDVDSTGALVPKQENILIGGNANGTVGVAATDAALVVAVSNGSPTATGTTLYGLAKDLSPIAAPSARVGTLSADIALAAAGTTIAFASQPGTTELDVRPLNGDASDAAAMNPITTTNTPGNASIVSNGTGFAVAYSEYGAPVATGSVALLDANLSIVKGPFPVPTQAGHDSYRISIAYAATSNVYLVTWHAKDVVNGDDVWGQLLDGAFRVVGQPFLVGACGYDASLATDGKDFWVSYRNYDPAMVMPDKMAASQVSATGTVTAVPVASSGGTPSKWEMIVRAGQPVLVWSEAGGSGPDLYFDAMSCN